MQNHANGSSADATQPRWVLLRSERRRIAAHDGPEGRVTLRYGWERAPELLGKVFVPMRRTIVTRAGRKVAVEQPAIPGLLFAHDTPGRLDRVMAMEVGLAYRFLRGRPYRQPVVIRDAEMDNFIAAVGDGVGARFLAPDSPELAGMKGRRVRLVYADGPLEGVLMSVRGSRRRRLLVEIPGLAALVQVDLKAEGAPVVELIDD